MATTFDSLSRGKYLSLTTFRRDGTAVATPVWLVAADADLLVITSLDAGKAKRIRNNSSVLVASCDARGRVSGAPVPAVARLQSPAESVRTEALIQRRYGLLGRAAMWRSRRAARKAGQETGQGICITLA
jgi:uncharacterized protein